MIDTHELKKRDLYLNKIIAFQDTEPVKVVTGIRRCGKSSLLKLMTLHLKENGVTDNQILEMNFESHAYKNMNSDSFYEYVKQHIVPNKRMYLSYQIKECTSFLMRFSVFLTGRMLLTLSASTSTAIFMSQAQMPICSPLNMPLIYLADV